MGVIIPAPLLWGLNEIRYVRILCKAKHIIKTWILTCLEIKMEDNTTMIKWLIFHLESGVCFLAIQGLAELGTFSISQCFFCLGRSNPSPTSASREVHRESLAVSPQPCPHPVCLLDANRKKLTEGSRERSLLRGRHSGELRQGHRGSSLSLLFSTRPYTSLRLGFPTSQMGR